MMRYRIGELLRLIDNLCCSRWDYSDKAIQSLSKNIQHQVLEMLNRKSRIQLNLRAAFIHPNAQLILN